MTSSEPTTSQIAHDGVPFHNPLPGSAIDAAIERLDLRPGSRVVDVGSGTGELLLRIVRRWPGTSAVGIDLQPAAPIHPDVDLRTGDAATVEGERFDLACCIGSVHALGGFPTGLKRLSALAPKLLVGDACWRHEPHPDYLDALGATSDELPDREGLGAAVAALGLEEHWSTDARVCDLTTYEQALLANADRHPARSDLQRYAAAIRRWRSAPGGTDTLGFSLLLLKHARVR